MLSVSCTNSHKVCLWTSRGAAILDGRLLTRRSKATPPSAPRGRFGSSGMPDSDRTGLAGTPEDWPAAGPRDAAAVTLLAKY